MYAYVTYLGIACIRMITKSDSHSPINKLIIIKYTLRVSMSILRVIYNNLNTTSFNSTFDRAPYRLMSRVTP